MSRCSVGEKNIIMIHNTVQVIPIMFVTLCSLQRDADQVVVAVVADKLTAVCAIYSSGDGAGVAHQISISFGEQRGGEHTCHWQ